MAPNLPPKLHEYPDRAALADGLAAGVAAVLAGGIATRGSAILAVSGGSTPKLFLERLSQAAIEWARVTICLVDERFVPDDHSRSNTRFLREHLIRGPAAEARLELFLEAGLTAREAAERLSPRVSALPRPFDVAVLGMGTDGHTASYFPDADRLAEALDLSARQAVIDISAPSADEPRLTLTLPMLADARCWRAPKRPA